MRVLALDSTTASGSVALCQDQHVLAEYTLQVGHTHSETLLPMVEILLKHSGWTVEDIDLFACTIGPGSFTGLRIGVATIKGLAFGQNKPCVGVSTLASLAYNGRLTFLDHSQELTSMAYNSEMLTGTPCLCPVLNARREQVYQAFFTYDSQHGQLVRVCQDRALPVRDLAAELTLHSSYSPLLLMGDGAEMTSRALAEAAVPMPVLSLPERWSLPSAYSTAQVAMAMYREGKYTTDASLAPIYLRMSQAERTRQEKLNSTPYSEEKQVDN